LPLFHSQRVFSVPFSGQLDNVRLDLEEDFGGERGVHPDILSMCHDSTSCVDGIALKLFGPCFIVMDLDGGAITKKQVFNRFQKCDIPIK
jgi:hypothetical protein